MSVKTVRLWDSGSGVGKLLIEGEILEAVNTNDCLLIETKVTTEALQKAYEVYADEHGNFHSLHDMEEFLDSSGIEYNDVSVAGEFEEPAELVVFDSNYNFSKLNEWSTMKIYTWFDGSNHRIEVNDENYMAETVLEIFKEYVDLDEWDGKNSVTGGVGLHQRVYRIYTIDGDEVSDTYLLEKWSQWQGSHATGEIMSGIELESHLEELGRDVAQYMKEVAELGN